MKLYMSIGNFRNLYANLRKCLCETCMIYLAFTYTDSRYSKLQLKLVHSLLFLFFVACVHENGSAFELGLIAKTCLQMKELTESFPNLSTSLSNS